MAIGDPSHEDAAADADAVLAVDDHGLARDAALGLHSRELRASTNRPACDGATVS